MLHPKGFGGSIAIRVHRKQVGKVVLTMATNHLD